MPLLTIDEAQARIPSPLSPVYLAALMADVEAEITAAVGSPDGAITETHAGYGFNLNLKRPIASVTSVTEYDSLTNPGSEVLTVNDDFFIWHEQGMLQRIHQKWKARVVVVYVPVDDSAKRRQVVVDLIKFYLAYSPLKSESISGEYSFTAPDNWEMEKSRLLRRLKFTEV